MALLQAYQADLLKDLNMGHSLSPEAVAELYQTLELTLKATKQTATAIASSVAALVVTERHLWLNLFGIKEKDKYFLLDTQREHLENIWVSLAAPLRWLSRSRGQKRCAAKKRRQGLLEVFIKKDSENAAHYSFFHPPLTNNFSMEDFFGVCKVL